MMLPPDEILDTVVRQFHKLLDYTIPVVSVLKGERISRSIAATLGGWDINDLMLGFYCISTNLTASRLELHASGDLAVAVRASVAIPGVLPPVPFRGDLLVDGGVLANLPVQQMRDHRGVGTIVAIDVSPTSGPTAAADFGHSLSGWRALRSSWGRRQSAYPSLSSVLIRTMMLGSVHQQSSVGFSGDDVCIKVDSKGVGLSISKRCDPSPTPATQLRNQRSRHGYNGRGRSSSGSRPRSEEVTKYEQLATTNDGESYVYIRWSLNDVDKEATLGA